MLTIIVEAAQGLDSIEAVWIFEAHILQCCYYMTLPDKKGGRNRIEASRTVCSVKKRISPKLDVG